LNPALKSLTGIDLAAALGQKISGSQAATESASSAHHHRASEKSAKK